MKEIVRDIDNSEMIFCIEYILFMYPKDVFHKKFDFRMIDLKDRQLKIEIDDSGIFEDDSFENDLSDIENEIHF